MAAGRKTGGRQKGTPNRTTAAQRAAVAASGKTPLDVMLELMRDDAVSPDMRLEAARSAAPYVHPRLASVTHKGDDDAPIRHVFEWATDEPAES